MRTRLVFIALLLAIPVAACGTATSQFPSRDELYTLVQRSAAKVYRNAAVADVESWTLTGPLPERAGDTPAATDGLAAALLKTIVDRHHGSVQVSAQSQCVAREMGIFFAHHRAEMSESLRRFTAFRCGLVEAGAIVSSVRYDEGGKTEAQMANDWKDTLVSSLKSGARGGPPRQVVGVWIGRIEGLTIISWITAARWARIDPMPLRPDESNQVILKGELLLKTDRIVAFITRGSHNVGICSSDPRVKLPAFVITCALDRGEEDATIQVSAFSPGRILEHDVAMLCIEFGAAPAKFFRRPELVNVAKVRGTGGDPTYEFAALVAAVRTQAGMPPLTLSTPESFVADRLAPHFFAALSNGEPPSVADKVILGMRAGWDVGVPLRAGIFGHMNAEGDGQLSRMLADLLTLPRGRRLLLDPRSTHIAFGAAKSAQDKFLGAIIATYAPFDARDTKAEAAKVWNTINAARAKMGMPPLERFEEAEDELDRAAAAVQGGGVSPEEVVDQVVDLASRRSKARARGYFLTSHDVSLVRIPDEILLTTPLRMALSVGSYKAQGEPWHQYVLFFVLDDLTRSGK